MNFSILLSYCVQWERCGMARRRKRRKRPESEEKEYGSMIWLEAVLLIYRRYGATFGWWKDVKMLHSTKMFRTLTRVISEWTLDDVPWEQRFDLKKRWPEGVDYFKERSRLSDTKIVLLSSWYESLLLECGFTASKYFHQLLKFTYKSGFKKPGML